MKTILKSLCLIWCLTAIRVVTSAEESSLNPHLEPLRPLLERTWQGAFKDSKPDQPTVDVMRWERALNGNAIRVLHSINDGVYGGETLIVWDQKKQAVTYYYFTTAGFMTTGTMTFQNGKIISLELVSGSANGVTEVRGTSGMQSDGSFHVKTEHRKDGKWSPGHEVTYKEAPSAQVRFK